MSRRLALGVGTGSLALLALTVWFVNRHAMGWMP